MTLTNETIIKWSSDSFLKYIIHVFSFVAVSEDGPAGEPFCFEHKPFQLKYS